jgi:hypothetical protein
MKTPSGKENDALLLIFKNFSTDYTANSISKKLNRNSGVINNQRWA